MTNSDPTPPLDNRSKVTPQRCLFGAAIAGGLGWGVYSLTKAIAISFAHTPIKSDNLTVMRIASAVRTLVLGVASLATFVFVFVAFGLILLALQLLVQGISQKKSPSEP